LTTTVGIYDISTGGLRFPPVVVDGGVSSAAFTAGGAVLAVSFPDVRLIALDAVTGVQVATAPGMPVPNNEPTGSGLLTVGDELLLGSAYYGTVRVFDAFTFELRRTITEPPKTVSRFGDVGDGTIITAGDKGIGRIDLTTGALRWQRAGDFMCTELTIVAGRDTFYCGNPFGRLEERDLGTGMVLRRLDAQNGNSGTLWPARGGRELVSFNVNEPVIARWRLDGSGPITRVVAPGYDPVGLSPDGERLIVGRGQSNPDDNRVVDVQSGAIVRDSAA
jgi:outer membrane protein assembly factor BamB